MPNSNCIVIPNHGIPNIISSANPTSPSVFHSHRHPSGILPSPVAFCVARINPSHTNQHLAARPSARTTNRPLDSPVRCRSCRMASRRALIPRPPKFHPTPLGVVTRFIAHRTFSHDHSLGGFTTPSPPGGASSTLQNSLSGVCVTKRDNTGRTKIQVLASP